MKSTPFIDIGSRRELFVDDFLFDTVRGLELHQATPLDQGPAFYFEKPWERNCGYFTILHESNRYRAFYRGKRESGRNGVGEVTCIAQSEDGIDWVKPELGLVEIEGCTRNNAILSSIFAHNLSPMLDTNPHALAGQRYKALAGLLRTGLFAFSSPDGLHWTQIGEKPVLDTTSVPFPKMFDSQNVAFWSEAEGRYVTFFRVYQDGIRRICRAESDDFLNWRNVTLMEYRWPDGYEWQPEHLYVNQTHPYFRAPHLYIALAARFMPGRKVLTDEQATEIGVHANYFNDCSDVVLLTSRGGGIYDRCFPGAFVRPGIGARNWVSRNNYPALNTVQTGPTEMSIYLVQDYMQPTAHLQRYTLRLDGFGSLRASYRGGEMVTKPLVFDGDRLMLNFSTSAAGGIRVEIQDQDGKPFPGYALEDCDEVIGNEIERAVQWRAGGDLSALSGQQVRLRFVMHDADLFAFSFPRSLA